MTNGNRIRIVLGMALTVTATAYLLAGCKTIPNGVSAIKPFEGDKYLGKWYEIARFDYSFEKHMDNVTATYSKRDDGKIKVDNRGYNYKKDKWKESIGKAKFAGDKQEAKLKVSFFGPFYAGYNVIAIDPQYRYAMVAGKNRKYLWLLSREQTMPEDVKQSYLQKAKTLGFKVSDLIWVKQDKS